MTTENKEPEVTISFTVNQLNVIIAGLDELPHKMSRPLIDKISRTAEEQLKPQGELASKVVQ